LRINLNNGYSHRQNKKENRDTIYAFIDASNLFYGGEKNLGWKIDYRKTFNLFEE